MKKFLVLFFSFLFFFSIGIQTGFATNWDWTDDTQYFDWSGNHIPSPWLNENHSGVDLTSSNKCPYSAGWRLYEKRLTYEDQFTLKSYSSTQPNTPYFVLYNVHTGVMRFFVYIGGSNVIGEDSFIFRLGVVDGANSPYSLGLFVNEPGDESWSIAEKAKVKDKKIINIGNAYYKKWFVVDYFLSYDPSIESTPPYNVFFHVELYGKNTQTINIGGDFAFDLNTTTSTKNSLFGSIVDTVLKAPGQISKKVKDVTGFASSLKKESEKQQEKGNTWISNKLMDAHNLLDPITGEVGTAIAATDIISSFTNIKKVSKQTSYSHGKGSITLDGTIVNDLPISYFDFGISKVNYGNSAERPEYQGKLGLFSFKRQPDIDFGVINYEVVGEDYWGEIEYWDATDIEVDYMSESYFRSLININPETNMELVKLKIQPHIKLSTNQFYQNQGYIPGPDGYYKYDHMVDPDVLSAHYFALLASSEDHFGGGHIGVVDAYYKIYMKFQHKTDPSICVEVLRTYKAKICIRYGSK